MHDFFKRLRQHPKLKRDIIECTIAEVIIFLVAYLMREKPIAEIGLIFLVVGIWEFAKRIRRELY